MVRKLAKGNVALLYHCPLLSDHKVVSPLFSFMGIIGPTPSDDSCFAAACEVLEELGSFKDKQFSEFIYLLLWDFLGATFN